MRQLFGSSLESMSAYERTNSLIVSRSVRVARFSSEQLLNVIYGAAHAAGRAGARAATAAAGVAGEGSFRSWRNELSARG